LLTPILIVPEAPPMLGRTRLGRCLSLATILTLTAAVGYSGGAQKEKEKAKAPAEAKAPSAEYTPTGQRLDTAALTRFIDASIDKRLAQDKITPSPLADDAEFMRRVYLDLVGHIPPADKAVAFLDSKDPQKRAKLIDELLASPEYGKHQADIWQALMLPRTSDNRNLNREPLTKWLEENFNANKPWDAMVTDIVTASGTSDKNGAVTYWAALGSVDKMNDSVTKLFMGIQLQCAQCHNHPFVNWKQTEYWGMAAFFMKVQATAPQQAARNGANLEVVETAQPRRGRNALPESAKIVPAKFFGAEEPQMAKADPYRPVLAKWLVDAKNPYFSKAMVNRTWYQLFGRGIVTPVDDMHDGNPATHPELLGELAYQFSANGYDLKALYRAICNSKAYQRTSKPAGGNEDAPQALYARMPIKVMTGEQLFDSLSLVLGAQRGDAPRPGPGGRGQQGNARTQFVNFFLADEGADPTEYASGIPQALRLMNSPQLNNTARLNEIVKDSKTPEAGVEKLFLVTLSRRPTDAESKKYAAYVASKKDPKEGYADLLWALLNSSAFTMNH
jgi:hypothetical protein